MMAGVMNRSRWLGKAIVICFLFHGCFFTVWGEESDTGYFKKAFFMFKNDLTSDPVPVSSRDITDEPFAIAGKMLKNPMILYYKSLSNVYIYFYAYLPEQKFILINPGTFNKFNQYNHYYVPQYIYFKENTLLLLGNKPWELRFEKEAWEIHADGDCRQICLDEGRWEFHFLVYIKRLPEEIEKLLKQLTQTVPGEKAVLIENYQKLTSEINKIKVQEILNTSSNEMGNLINAPSRGLFTKDWITERAGEYKITGINESVFYYACKK